MNPYLKPALDAATDPKEISRLTRLIELEEAEDVSVKRMIMILKSLGISMSVSGCGCCGSPEVDFSYKGEKIVDASDCNFNTDC